jgi:site-specific DNA-methyltransferase (adenine-specific)
MSYKIIQGDNRETLKTIPDNSIDAIVTDPPYGIDFLGKAWDANTGALETYQECLRVLKPGGHILAFSAARTYHHLAITLEQAGFEIRDQIMWIYSSGFPKSQDIGKSIERSEKKRADNALGIKRSKIESGPKTNCPKCNKTLNGTNQNTCAEQQCDLRDALAPADNDWAGWGTQLKPAHEPIALARKPMKTSIAQNCQKWGTGALNIDATRIPYDGPTDKPVPHGGKARQHKDSPGWMADNTGYGIIENPEINPIGRFPSNVVGEILQEDYQKYFYCPKVSRKERHIGHDMPPPMFGDKQGAYDDNGQRYAVELDKRTGNVGNNHPTVKPVELMKYLIKLVTPPGGTVLDPFNGSGSTGMAAVELGHPYIGCELDPAYVEIAEKRIAAWLVKDNVEPVATTFEALFQ